jgi:hypothetical protein
MNFGPLEFADYLRRSEPRPESDTIRAARAAKPQPSSLINLLTVVSGPRTLPAVARVPSVEAVSVYEAVAMGSPGEPRSVGAVEVSVRKTSRPLVLVLSSHQPVEWRLSCQPGATLAALLLSGYRQSTVVGAEPTLVHRIGGFYAFRRGSAEYRHLESEVLRCTGRPIDNFQSMHSGSSFVIG